MTKEIILKTVGESELRGSHLVKFLKNAKPEVWNEIVELTKFLDIEYAKDKIYIPFQARMFCIKNDIHELPKCENTDCSHEHPVRWNYQTNKFNRFCGIDCKNKWFKEASSMDMFREKINDTCEKKYGDRNIFRSKHFKDESSKTCMKNHGVKHISMSRKWRDGVKKTFQQKYGADSPFESKEIQSKIMQRCLEQYGVTNPLLSKEFQEKARNTIIQNHGGVGYAAKDIMDKAYKTSEKKYGAEHFTQTIEYQQTKKHKFKSEKYPELTFDSRWEIKVYEFCRDNDIQIEYQPSISYEYEYDGTTWTYHPDFQINGKLCEVKGDHFFRINEFGKEEMFCPFKNPNWSDEKYDWMCKKFNEKYHCMLKNNVRILRDADIQNLSVNMFVN